MKQVVKKIKEWANSDEGKRVRKAGGKALKGFLSESGLGKKAVDKGNEYLAKKTGHNQGLDNLRQFGHKIASDYFQQPQALPSTPAQSTIHAPSPPYRTNGAALSHRRRSSVVRKR